MKKFPLASGRHEISFSEVEESLKENAERQAKAKKMVSDQLKKFRPEGGAGAFRMQGRSPVFELKIDGEPLGPAGEFQHQLRNSADWELLFDSSSVQQSADQPFILSPTSWNPKYELYLWIQKVKR